MYVKQWQLTEAKFFSKHSIIAEELFTNSMKAALKIEDFSSTDNFFKNIVYVFGLKHKNKNYTIRNKTQFQSKIELLNAKDDSRATQSTEFKKTISELQSRIASVTGIEKKVNGL